MAASNEDKKNFSRQPKKIVSLFNQQNSSTMEEELLHIMKQGTLFDKNELKLWLVNSISNLKVDTDKKCTKFVHCMERNPRSIFSRQLLLFTCMHKPKEVTLFINVENY
jgi:hypothetical protein